VFSICSMEVETLGDAFTHSWRVTARCAGGVVDDRTHTRPCVYREELDLHTLVWTRGRNFPLARLESRLIGSAMWKPARRVGLSTAGRTPESDGQTGLALLIVPEFKTLSEGICIRNQKRIDHFRKLRFLDRIEAVKQRHQFLKGYTNVHVTHADTLFDGEHHKLTVAIWRRHEEFYEPIFW